MQTWRQKWLLCSLTATHISEICVKGINTAVCTTSISPYWFVVCCRRVSLFNYGHQVAVSCVYIFFTEFTVILYFHYFENTQQILPGVDAFSLWYTDWHYISETGCSKKWKKAKKKKKKNYAVIQNRSYTPICQTSGIFMELYIMSRLESTVHMTTIYNTSNCLQCEHFIAWSP